MSDRVWRGAPVLLELDGNGRLVKIDENKFFFVEQKIFPKIIIRFDLPPQYSTRQHWISHP